MKLVVWLSFCSALLMGHDSYAQAKSESDDILVPSKRSTRIVIREAPRYKLGFLGVVAVNDVPSIDQKRIDEFMWQGMASDAIQLSRHQNNVSAANPIPDKRNGILLDELEVALKNGKTALEQFQFAKAAQIFNDSYMRCKDAPMGAAHVELLKQIYLYWAEALQRAQSKQVEDVLRRLASLDVNYELDKNLFPSTFVARYESVRKRALEQKRAAIVVAGNVPQSRVFLDGKELGMAPLKIADVISGDHWVMIEAPGYESFGEWIDLAPGASLMVGVNAFDKDVLLSTKSIARNIMPDGSSRQRLADYAAKNGLDAMIFGVVAPSQNSLRLSSILVEAKTGRIAQLSPVEIDEALLNAPSEIQHSMSSVVDVLQTHRFAPSLGRETIFAPDQIVTAAIDEVKFSRSSPRIETVVEPSKSQKRAVIAFNDVNHANPSEPRVGVSLSNDQLEEKSTGSSWFWPVVIGGSVGLLAAGGLAIGGVMYFAKATSADVTVHMPAN